MSEILAALCIAAATVLPVQPAEPATAELRQGARSDSIRTRGVIYFDAPTRTPQTMLR